MIAATTRQTVSHVNPISVALHHIMISKKSPQHPRKNQSLNATGTVLNAKPQQIAAKMRAQADLSTSAWMDSASQ